MGEKFGIYWIQGLIDGEWSNLQRCDDHADAVSKMGPLANDKRYTELRLVLAQVQKGKIEYTTLVTVRDGEVISDSSLLDSLLPSAEVLPQAAPAATDMPDHRSWRVPVLILILMIAIGGGIAIANHYPNLAIAIYERFGWKADIATRAPVAPRKDGPALTYSERLFHAVDGDNGPEIRRLMAARPSDLRLDELLTFVDDSWRTGPRKIADYALLGGNMSAADALLAAGATPSNWLLALARQNPDEARLQPAIGLLNEYGLARPISLNTAIMETSREFQGRPLN